MDMNSILKPSEKQGIQTWRLVSFLQNRLKADAVINSAKTAR